MHLSPGLAITKNVLKFTALWTLMMMWTGSHMLETVLVAAAVVAAVDAVVSQEVRGVITWLKM